MYLDMVLLNGPWLMSQKFVNLVQSLEFCFHGSWGILVSDIKLQFQFGLMYV